MYSIGDSVKILTNEQNVVEGSVGVVIGMTQRPNSDGDYFENHYLVLGRGFEKGYLFTEEELELWELPIEQKQPLSVEDLKNLKREAEGKINDILETLGKQLGSIASIDSITFNEVRPITGKRYNTRIKVIVS